MFDFLCCCTNNHQNNLPETEEGKEENQQLLKILSSSNKNLKTTTDRMETEEKSSAIIDEDEYFKSNLIIRESWMIRTAESHIEFSKNGLIDLYNRLENSTGLTKFYDKNNLTLSYDKNGSELTKNFYLGKSYYKMSKKELYTSKDGTLMELMNKDKITRDDISKFMYNPQLRLKWDKSIKNFQMFDKSGKEIYDNNTEDNVFVIYVQYHSAAFFISKRDAFYKNIVYKDGNTNYIYGSSIEDNENINTNSNLYSTNTTDKNFFIKETEEYVRCISHLNLSKFEEDEEYFYFTFYNQTDIKVTSFYSELMNELKEEVKNRYSLYSFTYPA